jgi:hypothetical protein
VSTLTPEQLEEMRVMNPMPRAQFEQEERERRWLEGEDISTVPGESPEH